MIHLIGSVPSSSRQRELSIRRNLYKNDSVWFLMTQLSWHFKLFRNAHRRREKEEKNWWLSLDSVNSVHRWWAEREPHYLWRVNETKHTMMDNQKRSRLDSSDTDVGNRCIATFFLPQHFQPGEWNVICQRGRENYDHGELVDINKSQTSFCLLMIAFSCTTASWKPTLSWSRP